MKTDIRNIKREELEDYIAANRQPSFRSGQILEWIWKKGIVNFSEMKNIPSVLREKLDSDFEFMPARKKIIKVSTDNTRKVVFGLFDGNRVEGVIIPSGERNTACISTQAGCQLNCRFCATGHYGFKRDLSAGEIFDQFFILNEVAIKESGKPLTNVVLMGMGEPFLNLENVQRAMLYISSHDYLNFSPTRITFSTIGIPAKINKLSSADFPYNLALSLHSSIPEVREKIIPAAKKYPLDELRKSLVEFTKRTKKPVTVEFLLLKGVNTSKDEADSLIRFCSGFSSKINLIVYNEVPALPFKKPDEDEVAQFLAYLKRKNFIITVRKSMGNDIDAACGQLANKS